MADNKLQLTDKDLWDTPQGFIASVGVLVYDVFDGVENVPISGAAYSEVDGELHLEVSTVSQTRFYPLENEEDLEIDSNTGNITFSSYGRIYTIRAFQDSDGIWASRLRIEVPAESLEERYMTELENAFSPNAPADDENLYAAVDEDTNEVKFLVYSTTSGMYMRSDRGWQRVPEGDESLDDLTVIEVDPKFIKIFDMAEGNEDVLLSDDVDKYEVEFRGALTAAALAEELIAEEELNA